MNPIDPPAIVRQHSLLAEMVSKAKPVIGEFVNIERMNLLKAVQVGNLLKSIQDRCLTENISYLKTLEDLGIDFRRASETIRVANVPAPELAKCKSIRQALRVAGEGSPYPMEQRCRDCRLEQLDKKNCKKCKEKNAPESEPGDDTPEPDEYKKTLAEAHTAAKAAFAKELLDTKEVANTVERLKDTVRNMFRLAGAMPTTAETCPGAEGIIRFLEDFQRRLKKQAEQFRKTIKPPEEREFTNLFEHGPHV